MLNKTKAPLDRFGNKIYVEDRVLLLFSLHTREFAKVIKIYSDRYLLNKFIPTCLDSYLPVNIELMLSDGCSFITQFSWILAVTTSTLFKRSLGATSE